MQTEGDWILKKDNRFIEASLQVKKVRKEAAREKNRGHIYKHEDIAKPYKIPYTTNILYILIMPMLTYWIGKLHEDRGH